MDEFKTGDKVDVKVFGAKTWHPRIFLCFQDKYIWAYEDPTGFAVRWDEVRHSRKPAPNLPVDHPVWVKDSGGHARERCLSDKLFRNNLCYCWDDGRVKHTASGAEYGWEQYSLDGKVWFSAETHEEVEP